jgi:hypothetical protein
MNWLKPTLWIVATAFSAFSLWVLLQIGYLDIWRGGFANLGSTQITLDLVIACAIGIGFIARDCRAQGQIWWPWAVLTLSLGSIGLMAYLLWNRRSYWGAKACPRAFKTT